jgi:hypothetical protein
MNEENETQDEIKLLAAPAENNREAKNNTRRDFYIELALFLILGVLIGITVKTEANKRITIGYNDYKMKTGIQQYSINKLQSDLIRKQNATVDSTGSQGADQNSAEGASCTDNK